MANEQNNGGSALARSNEALAMTRPANGPQHDTAIAASTAQAQALVQARYLMAYQRPRDWDDTRVKLLNACKRPRFAETAIYAKPVGGGKIEGPSIRFAEEAARAMGNVDIQTPVLFDDFEKRIIGVRVTELESNTTYTSDVTISKTVERRSLKSGQQAIGQRLNSSGQTVYIVEATDDDLLNKQNALVSKSIRTGILRVLPSDIREEALDQARETMERGDSADPSAARKKVADAFSSIGVSPSELKKYLGHELSTCSPGEMADLRKVYASIKEGEGTWADHLKLAHAEAESEKAEEPKSRSQSAKDAVKARAKQAAAAGADDQGELRREPADEMDPPPPDDR